MSVFKVNESKDLRAIARTHLDMARQHMSTCENDKLKYAALELRMCIETLAWDILRFRYSEASFKIINSWQPPKILKELEAIIEVYGEDHKVSFERDGRQILELAETRLSNEFVKSAWHKLGNYLHVSKSIILGDEDGRRYDRIRSNCEDIAKTLDAILSSVVINLKIGKPIIWQCDCGFEMERSLNWLEKNNHPTCPNCGAIHDLVILENEVGTKVLQAQWDCKQCFLRNYFPAHLASDGAVVECHHCDAEYRIKYQLTLESTG